MVRIRGTKVARDAGPLELRVNSNPSWLGRTPKIKAGHGYPCRTVETSNIGDVGLSECAGASSSKY